MRYTGTLIAVKDIEKSKQFLQILQEERFLASTFGDPYQEYCRRVFRYLGRRKEHK